MAALSSRELDCRAPIIVGIGRPEEGNARSTYVRPDGRPLFNLQQHFRPMHRFHFGHAVVGTSEPRENRAWGIIDVEGRFTLPLGPEPVRPAGDVSKMANTAIFSVGTGDAARLTDAQGKPVPEVDAMLDRAQRQQALSCEDGAVIVGDGERFGIAGPDGKILVPAVHRAVSCFRSGGMGAEG